MTAPTLEGHVTADGVHVRVWCQHCVAWHAHGHGGAKAPLGAGDGHRVAHCHNPASPYKGTGYTIREIAWIEND